MNISSVSSNFSQLALFDKKQKKAESNQLSSLSWERMKSPFWNSAAGAKIVTLLNNPGGYLLKKEIASLRITCRAFSLSMRIKQFTEVFVFKGVGARKKVWEITSLRNLIFSNLTCKENIGIFGVCRTFNNSFGSVELTGDALKRKITYFSSHSLRNTKVLDSISIKELGPFIDGFHQIKKLKIVVDEEDRDDAVEKLISKTASFSSLTELEIHSSTSFILKGPIPSTVTALKVAYYDIDARLIPSGVTILDFRGCSVFYATQLKNLQNITSLKFWDVCWYPNGSDDDPKIDPIDCLPFNNRNLVDLSFDEENLEKFGNFCLKASTLNLHTLRMTGGNSPSKDQVEMLASIKNLTELSFPYALDSETLNHINLFKNLTKLTMEEPAEDRGELFEQQIEIIGKSLKRRALRKVAYTNPPARWMNNRIVDGPYIPIDNRAPKDSGFHFEAR